MLKTVENAKKESTEIQDLINNLGKDISKKEQDLKDKAA